MQFEVTVKRKPNNCPKCGATKVANILYGMPLFGPELDADIREGRIVLGGCCQEIGSPRWQCAECETPFFREKDVAEAKKFYEDILREP